ncbi:MAG: iron-containing alcohol dehydrogenase [Anaerovoracaceae bacterium]|jgi:alcohol dehydrogenase YqhD (iron-dependent ADH family)
MQRFQYSGMPKVYFGEGALQDALDQELPAVGENVLLAYGGGSIRKNGVYDEVLALLGKYGKNVVEFTGIMANPTYEKVQEGAKLAKENEIDFILAVGGGSVIDCCKIVSAQAKMDRDIWKAEFEEHVFPTEFIPMGAVTTASGTGAEMNAGAVITNTAAKQKNGMGGALSSFVVLDPAYTLSVPKMQAVSGAFDTLSHCMETYFGRPAENNVSDEMNEAVMRNTIRNIRAMIRDPKDVGARAELMWDSSMAENGILKLGKTTDFQVHMLEHQLGAYTDCSHGQGLAVLHPAVYRHLLKDNTAKFARFAREVWGVGNSDPDEKAAEAGIDALAGFIREIGLPTTLRELKKNMGDDQPDPTDVELLRKVADSTIVTAGCARKIGADEFFEILTECVG